MNTKVVFDSSDRFDVLKVLSDAGHLSPVPLNRLNEWGLFAQTSNGDLHQIDLRAIAEQLGSEGLSLFGVSNCGTGQTPGGAGIFAHGMVKGLGYPVFYSAEPFGGGTATVLYAIINGEIYISIQVKNRPLAHDENGVYEEMPEVVRGYTTIPDRAENAWEELTEEAGSLLQDTIPLQYGGSGNINSSRHHVPTYTTAGFVYLFGEVSEDMLECVEPHAYAFKPELFASAAQPETKTLQPLQFRPLFGEYSPLNGLDGTQPKDQFSTTAGFFLLNKLVLQGKASVVVNS